MAGKFRLSTRWDPILIICQIVTLQSLTYASSCLLILVAATLGGFSPSIMFIFDHKMISLKPGSLTAVAHLASALVGALILKIFVERSKSCLDFSITYHVVHFILVSHYSNSFPDSFLWYLINIFGACSMIVTSEYLCRRDEMRSIPIHASV